MKRLIWALAIIFAVAAGAFLLAGEDELDTAASATDDLNEDEIAEVEDFVIGNAVFVLMHEAGHMLISEFGLPVLGREEDAVDALSTLIMLEAKDHQFDDALVDASDGWFLWAAAAAEAGEEMSFWDEHSIEEQRAYAIVCMMIGQDPEQFADLAALDDVPEERRESCIYEYQQTAASWYMVLEPHMRDAEEETVVDIRYDEVSDTQLKPYEELVREADLLGLVKRLIADEFLLDEGITFHATACGEPNAFWDPEVRTLTFCYELAQFHAALISDFIRSER